MLGIVTDLIKIFTPLFYASIIFSPIFMKEFLFRKEKNVDDDKVVYVKILKKTNNLFANDVEKVLVMNKGVKEIFDVAKKYEMIRLADHIYDMIEKKNYILTYTDRTYIALKNLLRNYLSIDKTLIRHINFCDAYSFTYKENIPIWRKTIYDYKNIFEFILIENNNDLELLHSISK